MPGERPIILFPQPISAERERKPGGHGKIVKPAIGRQYSRLRPTFATLQHTFSQKNLLLQQTPVGINPELALVFEVVGTVSGFFSAVKKTEGLEWMFEDVTEFEGDDDFYEEKHGQKTDKALPGKVYCIMSNQQALQQLLALWTRYSNGEMEVFQRGFTGLRDVFSNVKKIRVWSAADRVAETNVVNYWIESLEIDGDQGVNFEVELFYREDDAKREKSVAAVQDAVTRLGGHVAKSCCIGEICYHALLVNLPRNAIQELVSRYEDVELVQVDDIMFFRPGCQSAFSINEDTAQGYDVVEPCTITGDPVIALFDGVPLENHPLLASAVHLDDPDSFQEGYQSKYRIHGTAMASLIIHGDLNRAGIPLSRPLYVRPILKLHESMGRWEEKAPEDEMFVDLVHRAIRRLFDDADENAAPTVRVINFSIGDEARQFATAMSPLARLLDFLADKYSLLFIVSAGNHGAEISKLTTSFDALKGMSIAERTSAIFAALRDDIRNIRVLSPAESINSLTIGALYDDFCDVEENQRQVLAVERGMPSPYSSFGMGYRRMITPDLFFSGGRKFLRENRGTLAWSESTREPGCKVAAPYGDGTESGHAYSFGTSDAAAQITHEAGKCYDILEEIFAAETGANVPRQYAAVLLKGMLTHGASWGGRSGRLAEVTGSPAKQLARWVGNGIPDISRVEGCARNRITLIGTGALNADEGHLYNLPLPFDFSGMIRRKLTVTLAYFSPVESKRQAYRSSQLWFTIDDKEKRLFPDRQNTDWTSVRRGTLQHEIFKGENALVWDRENLEIKVSCSNDAGNYRGTVPYGLFVTFEIAEGLDVDVYSTVAARIKQPVSIGQNNV